MDHVLSQVFCLRHVLGIFSILHVRVQLAVKSLCTSELQAQAFLLVRAQDPLSGTLMILTSMTKTIGPSQLEGQIDPPVKGPRGRQVEWMGRAFAA